MIFSFYIYTPRHQKTRLVLVKLRFLDNYDIFQAAVIASAPKITPDLLYLQWKIQVTKYILNSKTVFSI